MKPTILPTLLLLAACLPLADAEHCDKICDGAKDYSTCYDNCMAGPTPVDDEPADEERND